MIMKHMPSVIAMGALLVMSGFFSGSEAALFSLTREQLAEIKGKKSKSGDAILRMLDSPGRLLATVLFGNMVVNILFFSLSSVVAMDLGRQVSPIAGAAVGFIALLLVIVFGEVSAKTIGVNRSEGFARLAAVPLLYVCRFLYPFSHTIERATSFLTRLIPRHEEEGSHVRPEELKMLVDMSGEEGGISLDARTMIHEVIELAEDRIKDAMVPRVDMTAFDLSRTPAEFMELVRRTRYKRIPVYEGTIDNIAGFITARDVFLKPEAELRTLARPMAFVPDNKTLEDMLRQFRNEGTQIAIALDEYGGVSGLITLEDIVEEVVGEIEDEFDKKEEPIRRFVPKRYLLSGHVKTREWYNLFGAAPGNPRADTVGGCVTALLGRLPKEGEVVHHGNLRFTVQKVRRRRVEQVMVELLDKDAQDSGKAGNP